MSGDLRPIIRLGRWQDALRDVERVDCLITDPPFGARTHTKQRVDRHDENHSEPWQRKLHREGLGYAHWTEDDVGEFVEFWSPRVAGWFCVMSDHGLQRAWERELERAGGRYVFAPLPCVQQYRTVRLAGDGPASWTDWLTPARPRSAERWGALPGSYVGPCFDAGENALDRSKKIKGAKPLWLMRAIVRDYSRPGDLVCDPCAGHGATLMAAAMEGRRSIGAEMDPATFRLGRARLARPIQADLFTAPAGASLAGEEPAEAI